MASFKELSLSRPFPHSNNQRHHHHSHSISLGAVNQNHRVTRRKSVTTTAAATNAAAAAVAAVSIKDSSSGEPSRIPMPLSNRRGSGRKPLGESSSVGPPSGFTSSYLSRRMSVTGPGQDPSSVAGNISSAPDGAAPTTSTTTTIMENGSNSAPNNRNRRASEGSHLIKGEGKRSLAEIRCDRCGKGYKHGSCLSKHMWEHDPAWAITSKLLISKHQQVQLLEAASVLVNMNTGPDAESELSSASPDASSELREGISSADTTPPPLEQVDDVEEDEDEDDMEQENDDDDDDDEDDLEMSGVSSTTGDKRFTVPNNNSSNPSGLYPQSYQSGPSSSFAGSAPLHSPSFSNYRHSSIDTRPSTADTKLHEDDEADLAAAIGLCNFGTPRTRPVAMSPSIPPVPPLPSRFLDPNSGSNAGQESRSLDQSKVPEPADTAFPGSIPNMFLSVPSLSYKVSDEREVRLGNADRTSRQNRNADVDFGSRPAPADDDDDGVFGRMEE